MDFNPELEDKHFGIQDIMLELEDDDDRWKPYAEVHESRWRDGMIKAR